MKKFKIIKFKCGTIEQLFEHIIIATDAEEARRVGEITYGSIGTFIGAERILDNTI